MEKPVIWLPEDEKENVSRYGITFEQANEVVENQSSFMVANIHGDYLFIGLDYAMEVVIKVYCIDDDGFRRIKRAERANASEADAYFAKLAGE